VKEPRRSRRRRIGGCLEESRGGGGGGGEDLLRFLVTCTRVPRRRDGVSSIENRRKVRNSWGMGCRALRTGGKLGIRSSWAGAGRNRKSGDWSPSSAYTDHGPAVSVHTGRAVSCFFH
jgi:hypothetical protein